MLPDQDALAAKIRSGEVDTILVVFPDVFGRLVGKRVSAQHFLRQHMADEGTHGCNYLLTLNIEMDPLDGFKLANWDAGFGDFQLQPDLSTFRNIPWQQGAVMVLCDAHHHNGDLVQEAPRSVLRKQLDKLN